MRDSNTAERLQHESQEVEQSRLLERCRAQAWELFFGDELNDQLDEIISDQPMDARNVALQVLYPEKIAAFLPSHIDLRAAIENMVEKHAHFILEGES